MTTWQDQQPMSRRALRENERAHAQNTVSETDELDSEKTDFDQQIWGNPNAVSPLDYSPEIAPPLPPAVEPLRRPRQSGSSRLAPETPAYRVRDFSPETRGGSFSSTQSAPWTPPSPGSEDLSYHTSVEANRPTQKASGAPIVAPPVVVTPEDVQVPLAVVEQARFEIPIEHTLTRRELREMRNAAAHESRAGAAIAPVWPRLDDPPIVEPELSEPVLSEPVLSEPELSEPVLSEPVLSEPELSEPVLSEPVLSEPELSDELAASMAEFDKFLRGEHQIPTLVEPAAAEPIVAQPLVQRPASPSASVVSPPPPPPAEVQQGEPLREVITAPEVYSAPAGHWSNPAALDESFESVAGPHKRDISSSGVITTSALVLPDFSGSSPMTGPISGTGEILLTGSINLPRSLGSKGLHPSRYDMPDIDAIIDAADHENSAPDSAPVRAVRAVSTYTSSQGIISTKRPKGNNLPMILSITAGVMMVGVVVLVVVGMIFKIF